MNDAAKLEARLLTATELELVAVTRPPAIESQSVDQLKAAARRLREAHDARRGSGLVRRARCAARPSRAGQRPRKTTREPSRRRRLCATRSTGWRRNLSVVTRRRFSRVPAPSPKSNHPADRSRSFNPREDSCARTWHAASTISWPAKGRLPSPLNHLYRRSTTD